MGVGCCVRVLRARSQRPGQSRRVRREGCRGSTGWGLYKGPIPIVISDIISKSSDLEGGAGTPPQVWLARPETWRGV
jgi:hypothetical protein